jgi:hypothetical protein
LLRAAPLVRGRLYGLQERKHRRFGEPLVVTERRDRVARDLGAERLVAGVADTQPSNVC